MGWKKETKIKGSSWLDCLISIYFHMAAGQEWRNSNSTILPLQTSLAFASTDQLPSKVPDIRKPLSLCAWIWGRQVVALKGGGCQQLFQLIYHLEGACEAAECVLKKCWISERARLFPWPPRCSFTVLAMAVFPRYLRPVSNGSSWIQA